MAYEWRNILIMTKRLTENMTSEILWTSETLCRIRSSEQETEYPSIPSATLEKVLKRDLIHVDQDCLRGTVLSRAYRPSCQQGRFWTEKILSNMKRIQGETTFPAPSSSPASLDRKQPPEDTGRKSIARSFWHRKKQELLKTQENKPWIFLFPPCSIPWSEAACLRPCRSLISAVQLPRYQTVHSLFFMRAAMLRLFLPLNFSFHSLFISQICVWTAFFLITLWQISHIASTTAICCRFCGCGPI